MFGYCGTLESDVHELYAGLMRACASDPTLKAVAPNCSAHCHGWGYVIHADNGIFYYRSGRSIYEDKIVLPKLEGNIRAIFHGRYASKLNLVGHIFSHPYMAADDAKVTYFAHNGGVKPAGLPELKVDSEWALEEIVAKGSLAAALPELKKNTGSALNLLVLTIDRKMGVAPMLEYFHYFVPEIREKHPDKVEYYSMFEGKMPGGRALFSYTMKLPEAKVTSLKNVRQAEFDKLSSLEV
jgi:hypothetical protein